MNDHPQKYYLCQSGEVKIRAEQHRAAFTSLRRALFDVVHSLGVTQCSIQDSMMLLRGVIFDGPPPEGWTKKDRRDGCSRPKAGKVNADILKHFTPTGCYSIKTHPELRKFEEWLGCPMAVNWTKGESGSGWYGIGRMFADGVLYWYSATGPILAVLPDVERAKADALKEGQTVAGNALDWKPPRGLKEIMPEEWELMNAKYKKANP